MRHTAALGHMGLLLGLLAVVFMLGAINNSLSPSGGGWSTIYFPLILWIVGLVFVVGEWFEARRGT